jgi:O-antigen/teichoic acid export membrane protein
VSNKLISISAQIINIFFLLLINRFFYQEFGLFFLGMYSAAVILAQFILIFSDFGISASLTHEIAKNRFSNIDYVIKLGQFGFFVSIILFIFFVFLLKYLLQNSIFLSWLDVKNFENYLIIYYLIIGMLISIPRNALGAILMGFNQPHIWSFLNLFSNFINLFGLLIALYFGFSNFLIGYVYIVTNILSFLIFAVCIIFYANHKILMPKFNFKILVKISNYSTKIYLGSLISFFSSFIDRILVFFLISINYLGIYSIIHNISQKIEIVGSSIAVATFSELSSSAKNSKEQFMVNSKNWLEFTNFMSLNAGILIFFFSDFIYYFIFNKFPDYQIKIIFLIIILAYILKSICNLIVWIISSFNKPEVQVYYGIVSSLTYFIIIFFFFNNLKIEVIASAFLFSNFLSLIFLIKYLNEITNSRTFVYIYKKFIFIFLGSLIYLIFSYLLFYYLSKNIFAGLLTYLSYLLFLVFVFLKTNLLSNYKENKIIKFILTKLK